MSGGPFAWCSALLPFFLFFAAAASHSCSNNRIPYGIEIFRDGQPALLCSRPSCFEKTYADCDERALRHSCPSNTSWVGGFDKGYGSHQPLYVQCCEFEQLPAVSDPLYNSVLIRPGEYFEGEEINKPDSDKVIAFDIITNVQMAKEGPLKNRTLVYKIDVRRFYCHRLVKPKRYKPWSWP